MHATILNHVGYWAGYANTSDPSQDTLYTDYHLNMKMYQNITVRW